MFARFRLAPRRRASARSARSRRPSSGSRRTAAGRPAGADARRRSFGSCRPSGAPQVSGRKTIGASRPLLAWTVSTRTPSLSALHVALDRRRRSPRPRRGRGAATALRRCSWASASARNSSIGSAASGPEPGRAAPAGRRPRRAAARRRRRATELCARARQMRQPARRLPRRARRGGRERARRASRGGPAASANSSSSSRPISGDLRTQASVRSSSGRQRGPPGGDEVHHRDMVAQHQPVGARDLRRSGPSAPGSSPRKRRCGCAPGSSRRRPGCGAASRSSSMTRSRESGESQCRIVSAIRPREQRRRDRLATSSSSGMRQSAGSGSFGGADRRPELDHALSCRCGPPGGPAAARPARRRRARRHRDAERLIDRVQDRLGGAEGEMERHGLEAAAPLRGAAARRGASSRRISPAPRPGRRRSTASRRRRRRPCG